MAGRRLGEHVAHEVHHAPLVSCFGQHGVDGGGESRAPAARHGPHALQAAFDHASDELLPTVPVLPHALGHADDLAAALCVNADGDQDADVLHASAPGTLVPHAVHEHVRIFRFQRPVASFVDLDVHAPELVTQGLRGHAVAPQHPAGVMYLPGGHTRQVHVHQHLLDAGLAPPVAFDHRRLEQSALELGHLQLEPADLGRQSALVVTGPERLPTGLALVSGSVRDLVRLRVEHRVDDILDLRFDHGVKLGFEHGVVELYDFLGHGLAPLSNRGFLVRRPKIVHGTGHVLFQEARITKCAGFRALSMHLQRNPHSDRQTHSLA